MTRGEEIMATIEKHAPSGYDPGGDDFTVPFAIQLAEQDAKIAKLEAAQMTSKPARWKPIETAPKDGSVVDIWHPKAGRYADARYVSSEYCKGVEWGWTAQPLGRIVGATHWMPLPEPPAHG